PVWWAATDTNHASGLVSSVRLDRGEVVGSASEPAGGGGFPRQRVMASGGRQSEAGHVAVHRLVLSRPHEICLVPDPEIPRVSDQTVEVAPCLQMRPLRRAGELLQVLV